jgi:ABC-type transport system involved in multi-copper enzyme maturation permease subunit
MNKIINKGLFYKEWINVRWITLLTVVVLLYFKVYGVISELDLNKTTMKQTGSVWTDRWFNNGLHMKTNYFIVMVFIVIILAMILFIGEKTSETQGFIASMPFTRKEIILNKWLVGVISILISFVVTYIFLSLFYAANINSLDTALNPYSDIVKWFFMDTFQYICIFTFMLLAQAVMGNSIVSSIVGGIILLVPFYITMIVLELITRITKYQFIAIDKFASWLNIYSYNGAEQVWTDTKLINGKDIYRTFYYNNYGVKLLIFFLLTCLFLYLAYVSYKKRNLEYNLRLIVFKNLELVFICGVAICLGLLAGAVFGFGYSDQGLIAFSILAIIFTIIGYFISKLLLKIFSAK